MATGRLGAAALATIADTLLYTVPVGKHATININCVNRTADQTAVDIAIGTGAAPTAQDYIEYSADVPGYEPLERSGLVCNAGEKVWIKASVANAITVRIHGFEEDV